MPPATLRWLGQNLPAAGGAYFRLLPPVLVRAALREAERRGQPGTFYLHPWEYDPGQPRIEVPLLTRIRHYGGLAGVERLVLPGLCHETLNEPEGPDVVAYIVGWIEDRVKPTPAADATIADLAAAASGPGSSPGAGR